MTTMAKQSGDIFDFDDEKCFGRVISVDTATVILKVKDLETLRSLQVNGLVALKITSARRYLIGIVDRIRRTSLTADDDTSAEGVDAIEEDNIVRVVLIGTYAEKKGTNRHVFQRTLERVPEIDAPAFTLEGPMLTAFMQAISQDADDTGRVRVGVYTLDEEAVAFLDGNRFFQRHATIVGSTGSGKSYATAMLIEQIATLNEANALVFDIHGEYQTLRQEGIATYRIAGPADVKDGKGLADGVIYLPYWLLRFDALTAMMLERSAAGAPNQVAAFRQAVSSAKRAVVEEAGENDWLDNFTVDSPVPFPMDRVVADLEAKNSEMVPGLKGEKKGDLHDQLGKVLARIQSRREDRRFGFLFGAPEEALQLAWLEELVRVLVTNLPLQDVGAVRKVRIIDFSEVPSDILPLIVSLVAEIVFKVKQWQRVSEPIAMFCDEAHLYIPPNIEAEDALSAISLDTFERIAKEGRKYGIGLVAVTQRPAEVNRTVLSQCNNFIAMRLLNVEDRSVVKALLPDNLGGFSDLLPILDVGEALVVGDASPLPSRVRLDMPKAKPTSQTIPFWSRWSTPDGRIDPKIAVDAWRRQAVVR